MGLRDLHVVVAPRELFVGEPSRVCGKNLFFFGVFLGGGRNNFCFLVGGIFPLSLPSSLRKKRGGV